MPSAMSDTVVGVYTIGQTPRPDLTERLADRFGAAQFEIRGALDDLQRDQIPECGSEGYPLETRLHDGTRIVVDSAFLEPRLQQAVTEWDGRVAVHLILCAGSFPNLTARHTLIRPFPVAVAELMERALKSLEILVPFTDQATPSARKWEAAGFSCRMHALGEKPANVSAVRWLSDRVAATRADALVFDYVGFPAAMLHEVAGEVHIPVFDVGDVALDALGRTLQTL